MKLLGLALAIGILALGTFARAAALPVTIDCSAIITVQAYNLGQSATDQSYLLVTGAFDGKPISARFPQTGTWPSAPKQPAIDKKKPLELWKGQLDDGQFVILTVTLMVGKGDDAQRNEQFLGQLSGADQKVAQWSQPKLASDADLKKLAEETLNADQSVIKDIKKTYSRDKNTDHYGGQFTLIVWNNNGKLVKRLDPVGLTFGQHYGIDPKIYSKLKNTRANVLMKNDQGEWEELQLEPQNDDNTAIRVKELENEYVKLPGKPEVAHTTDYVIEIAVLGADGKPLTWQPEDEQTGVDAIHTYWNYAD